MGQTGQISEIIRNQIISFFHWKEVLKDELNKKIVKTKNICIISKEQLDEYQKEIFQNENMKKDEIIKMHNFFKMIDNNLLIVLSLRDLKSVYPLSWKSIFKDEIEEKPKIFQGEFYYSILFFKISKEKGIYCFFFVDPNDELIQGYIQIYKNNLEKKMIEELKSDFFEFLKKNNIKYDNEGLQLFSHFDIAIFNLEKNGINYTKEIKINHEEILSSIKNNIEGVKKELELKYPINKIESSAIKDSNAIDIFKENDEKKQKLQYKKTKIISKIIERYKTVDYSKKEEEKEKNTTGKRRDNSTKYIKFPAPGLKGLKNVGAVSYMNATIQCFSNIDKIRFELINKFESLKANNKLLSSALAEVIYNLWEKLDVKKFSPNKLKEIISMFKGIGANDPKDFILYMLTTIHKETNEKNKINYKNNEQPLDLSCFIDVYRDFIKRFSNQNNSIISNEFYGYADSMFTCCFCRKTIHNLQIFKILSFSLEEVRKFKGYYENIRVPLLNCFEYYEKYEMYTSFYCNYCNFCFPAYSNSKLIKTPNSLIINLDHGKGLKFNLNVTFEEYLDIKQFICSNESPFFYELKGVISHIGSNDDGGYFIAYCKNSNNCNWYKYNDEKVEECNFEDVVTKGLPYILFYSQIEVEIDENELQNEFFF